MDVSLLSLSEQTGRNEEKYGMGCVSCVGSVEEVCFRHSGKNQGSVEPFLLMLCTLHPTEPYVRTIYITYTYPYVGTMQD